MKSPLTKSLLQTNTNKEKAILYRNDKKSKFTYMKVFITGINGFVGQNLQPYLEGYFDIQGISRKEKPDSFTYEMFFKENRS